MKIRTTNSATSTIHDSDCMDDDYRVSFNDDDEATVKESVGEALVEKYAGIEPVEDDESDNDSDTDVSDTNE